MSGFGPSSAAVQWIAVGMAVAAVLALGLTWDLGARRRVRYALRTATVLFCVVGTAATVAVWANRETEAYTTWGSLTGKPPVATQVAPAVAGAPADPAGAVAQPPPSAPATGGPAGKSARSRIVTYQLAGQRSGLTLETHAYLPPGYDDPARAATRYPVIEALHGFPGSPTIWLGKLDAQVYLDTEITAGRMAPTVVLFPYQTPNPKLDTECTNLVGGPQVETFLTQDLPADAVQRFRVRGDRNAWGVIGYSAGGFCALNLTLRHPERFAAGASLSGWADSGITIGDGSEHTHNNPVWRLKNLPQPPVALLLATARDDAHVMRDIDRVLAVAKAPVSVDTALVKSGGHTRPVWRALSPASFGWLSARLARPAP
jgi:enterochelin esterase-like enzyme